VLLAVLVWWHVWTDHPSSTTVCGCGDPSLFTWFIAWPAHAISHGQNPLYSTAMFHPAGVNLLDNTSEVAFGIMLAPITWIFGPVTSLNVALTLTPALSALAMFALLRRWVSWTPAAYIGGLFYGFSPFVIVDLSPAHLMTAMLAIPPLIIIGLDELLIRQRHRPAIVGIGLALLLTVQFFIGTEMLLIVVFLSFIGITLVAIYGLLRDPADVRGRLRYVLTGLGTAATGCLVLLAYPVWFALDGPARISGAIWGGFGLSGLSANIRSLVTSYPPADAHMPGGGTFGYALNHSIGGYQGPVLSDQFFGYGVVIVLLAGLLIWRRDRRLWLFGALTVLSVTFSRGLSAGTWTPWRLFVRLPLFENIEPERLLAITWLSVAIMLGLVVGHTRDTFAARRRRALDTAGEREGSGFDRVFRRAPAWSGAAAALMLAAIAIAAPARYLAQGLPLTTQNVDVPTWFTDDAPHLQTDQVLLVLPAAFALESPMTWQAVAGMGYSMVGGGGPGDLLARAGKEQSAQAVITEISHTENPYFTITPRNVMSVRQALSDWGVTKVVLPDQANLPGYDEVQIAPLAAAVMTEATGERPTHQSGAWVWDTTALPPARPKAWKRTLACVLGLPARGTTAVTTATTCAYS
jgi:hypothetical protein